MSATRTSTTCAGRGSASPGARARQTTPASTDANASPSLGFRAATTTPRPSAVAAAAVSYTLEKIWGVRWDSMRELHKMSGYTKHDLAKVYAFFDRLVSDAYDSEELGRGLHINDKHQNATSILWRKAFFTIGGLDEGSWVSREDFGDSRGGGTGRFERAGAIADLQR